MTFFREYERNTAHFLLRLSSGAEYFANHIPLMIWEHFTLPAARLDLDY